MGFTAADVKNLREMTGVGMMDCKKALAEADGDIDKAVEWLREKSFNSAGTFVASRRTTPATSKSGAVCSASSTYLPIFPYPTMAALIFFICFLLLKLTLQLTK